MIVGQSITNNLAYCGNFGIEHQVAGIGRQVQIAVAVHSALEAEWRTCEIAEIAVRKNAKLKHRDERYLYPTGHVYRRSGGTNGGDLQRDRNDFSRKTLIRAGTDNAGSGFRAAIGIGLREGDVFQIGHAGDLRVGRRRSQRQIVEIDLRGR